MDNAPKKGGDCCLCYFLLGEKKIFYVFIIFVLLKKKITAVWGLCPALPVCGSGIFE